MRVDAERKLDFDDVLIRPKRSKLKSRAQIDLERTFRMLHSDRTIRGVPIIAANMDTVGTPRMAQALAKHRMFTALHKFVTIDECKNVPNAFAFVTLGLGECEVDESMDKICLDVANGYIEDFVDFIDTIRGIYPGKVIMAGNVATPDMTEALILAGADIVKVGIGPGSACTTRQVTGVGYPQLSAVIECADAAHGLGGLICSDGGCRTPGDVTKAFAAGADFVMLGGMLAGHAECFPDGTPVVPPLVRYYGMASKVAMDKHAGGVAPYRAAEGRVVEIDYRGSVDDTVQEILGGLRSACTYVGASKLKELSKRTTFVIVR